MASGGAREGTGPKTKEQHEERAANLPKLRAFLGPFEATLDGVIERIAKIHEACLMGLIDLAGARAMVDPLDKLRLALSQKNPKIARLESLVARAEALVRQGQDRETGDRQHNHGRGGDRSGLEESLAQDLEESKH